MVSDAAARNNAAALSWRTVGCPLGLSRVKPATDNMERHHYLKRNEANAHGHTVDMRCRCISMRQGNVQDKLNCFAKRWRKCRMVCFLCAPVPKERWSELRKFMSEKCAELRASLRRNIERNSWKPVCATDKMVAAGLLKDLCAWEKQIMKLPQREMAGETRIWIMAINSKHLAMTLIAFQETSLHASAIRHN